MRWEIIDNSPKRGDIRFKTRFAWLPTRVVSKLTITDHVIWLELYIEEQEYRVVNRWGQKYKLAWDTVAKTIHV
jgi:hypothetical protein